jgi:hypothetical protein
MPGFATEKKTSLAVTPGVADSTHFIKEEQLLQAYYEVCRLSPDSVETEGARDKLVAISQDKSSRLQARAKAYLEQLDAAQDR